MGVQLTLDDFGTCFYNLSYLKGFPIDALKIDKSFVRGLRTNAGDPNIVRAVINKGKSFGLRVIAEGVETLEQFLMLRFGFRSRIRRRQAGHGAAQIGLTGESPGSNEVLRPCRAASDALRNAPIESCIVG